MLTGQHWFHSDSKPNISTFHMLSNILFHLPSLKLETILHLIQRTTLFYNRLFTPYSILQNIKCPYKIFLVKIHHSQSTALFQLGFHWHSQPLVMYLLCYIVDMSLMPLYTTIWVLREHHVRIKEKVVEDIWTHTTWTTKNHYSSPQKPHTWMQDQEYKIPSGCAQKDHFCLVYCPAQASKVKTG